MGSANHYTREDAAPFLDKLEWDSISQLYRWKYPSGKWGRIPAGSPAGGPDSKGYIRIILMVDGKRQSIRAHRLLWIDKVGDIPKGYQVDHIDTDKTNNCVTNLRLAVQAEQSWNIGVRQDNTSGYKGVCLRRYKGEPYSWAATVTTNNKTLTKQFPPTLEGKEQAAAWVASQRQESHREFARST